MGRDCGGVPQSSGLPVSSCEPVAEISNAAACIVGDFRNGGLRRRIGPSIRTPIDSTSVKQPIAKSLSCTELASQIERLQPNAAPHDVARLCLLLTNSAEKLETLREQHALHDAWKRTTLKLQVATDQHAAMTEELEALAASDPQTFTQDQIWVLIRAIKVQSQVLQMYVGHSLLDV